MNGFDDVRSIRGKASGDQYSDWIDEGAPKSDAAQDPLDSDESRKEHRQLLSWFYHERDKQAANRLEQSIDHDFYDNIQWDPDDAAAVRARGQMPLVYNEVAPMVDWLIGTERRTRVDWSVLPRAEDDVKAADVKTKVLKYVSDVNRVPFVRSRAFADAVKGGVGWVDDGARDDPTQDVLYSKYEDWRNVLWDSASYELDLSDTRYLFRWRWVDEDIALMMFPKRKSQIMSAVEDADGFDDDELTDIWYQGEKLEPTGRLNGSGSASMRDTQRRRVKLYECQYRKPTMVKVVADGPLKGAFFNEKDIAMSMALAVNRSEIVDKVMMRVHFAVFTEASMLSLAPSFYRHNRFTLTPIWCYRRNRDRLPYGVIRRVRDIQQDLNKRASKALFMLNTNQIIADEGAVADKYVARDEADRPDGYIEKKAGKEFTIRRDTDGATGQIQMMALDAQSIQKTVGVNNENLGRQTNAQSGAAIEARQNQGSVGTTEPFDNLRLAVQVQGEKQLSLTEQFYTEEKVIRLTGSKGIEWVKVNTPEVQPDGTVRYLNDITNSLADFVVSEADYAGTLRQVMFDSLQQLVQKLPPEVGLRLFTLAMEFSDLPNKDEIADAIRQMTGERDPSKELTPEEQQQEEDQRMQQAEAMQMQRELAILTLEEQRAKVRELNAKAAKLEADAGGQDGANPEMLQAIDQVRREASDQIEALSGELRKSQAELANRTIQIGSEADTKTEIARIEADGKVRVAEIQDKSNAIIAKLESRLESMSSAIGDAAKQAGEAVKAATAAASEAKAAVSEAAKAAKDTAAQPAQAPNITVPITLQTGAIQVDARAPAGNKTITLQAGEQKMTGTIEVDGKGDKPATDKP